MNRGWTLIAGGALAAMVGAWAGLQVHFAHDGRSTPAARSAPDGRIARVPVGEASPPGPDDDFDPAAPMAATIPERLPEFSLSNRDGKPTAITTWTGKSLIINFWATWCAPCRHEIPLLQALSGEWRGRDVEVIGIAVDYRDKVVAFANDLKIGYPLLIGEDDALDAARALGVESPVFPFTVFTDRRGEVVALFVGELHRPQAELILAAMQRLNANLVQLPAARHDIAEGLRALARQHAG